MRSLTADVYHNQQMIKIDCNRPKKEDRYKRDEKKEDRYRRDEKTDERSKDRSKDRRMGTRSDKRPNKKYDRKVLVAEESTKSWADSDSDSSSSSSSSRDSEQEEVHCLMADQTSDDDVGDPDPPPTRQQKNNCGRNHQSGPRPETRLLHQPALEGLTRSARTDSPRRIGRKQFSGEEEETATTARRGGGGGAFREERRRFALLGLGL
ncbi:hypothetical protein F511_15011 [Dorcoceras hygrometricum]|uniref:Uncharacterized protein n=1 Tax=Dorcoceras hygrometricum TaxID=472368 RepID=A0A2Z7DAX7_9LAMI|nr:hypothetical protein F511_15011 [Dorcoceras hygrometricum]